LVRELSTIDTRYTIILMKIKKYDIANIKKKRITGIVVKFYLKLDVYNYVRNFLLIKFPFNFEIVVFVFRIKYDFKKII
jgi:hypothetical protein